MKRITVALVMGLGLAPAAHGLGVPGIDVNAGIYGWDAQPGGDIRTTRSGDTDVDVEDDLGFERNQNSIFYISAEHAVPFVPNVRLRGADISDEAGTTLRRSFTYNGQQFQQSEDARTSYQLDYTEATLYYSPGVGVAQVDIGITARNIDAEFAVRTPNRQARVEADGTIPMVHLGARADLPLTGFYVDGAVDTLSVDDSSLTDARAAVGWLSDYNLGVELGYQQMRLELDDVDDLDTDLDFSGPYLSVLLAI